MNDKYVVQHVNFGNKFGAISIDFSSIDECFFVVVHFTSRHHFLHFSVAFHPIIIFCKQLLHSSFVIKQPHCSSSISGSKIPSESVIMNLLSLFPKKQLLCRSRPASFIRPLSSATSGHPSIPFTPHVHSASSLSLYLLGLSVTACATLLYTEGKSASCTADNGADEKKIAFKSFLKELHVLLRTEQINVDADDCKDRGMPENSYHKAAVFPQVGSLFLSCHIHMSLLVSLLVCVCD